MVLISNLYSISRTLTITRTNDKAIKGTLSLYMESNFNGPSGRKLPGDFALPINPFEYEAAIIKRCSSLFVIKFVNKTSLRFFIFIVWVKLFNT
jgi:hypothetical protein